MVQIAIKGRAALEAGLQLMGYSFQDLVAKLQAGNPEKALEEWRTQAKKAYKAAILRWHPDRPDGCAEKTKVLTEAWGIVQELKIVPTAPPRPVQAHPGMVVSIRFHGFRGGGGGFSTTTTTTTTAAGWAWDGTGRTTF